VRAKENSTGVGDFWLFSMMFAVFYHLPLLLYVTQPDSFSSAMLMYGWINLAGIPLAILSAGELMPLSAFGASPVSAWQWLVIDIVWWGYAYMSSKLLLRLTI